MNHSHHVIDFIAENKLTFRAVLQVFDYEPSQVTFFDRRYDYAENGQQISTYNVETMLEMSNGRLNLYGGVEDWQIGDEDVALVKKWITQIMGRLA